MCLGVHACILRHKDEHIKRGSCTRGAGGGRRGRGYNDDEPGPPLKDLATTGRSLVFGEHAHAELDTDTDEKRFLAFPSDNPTTTEPG